MSKWFVRAKRGKTEIDMPIHDQKSTEVHIGNIHKKHEFKSARDVAYSCKKALIGHGWKNVRVVRVDS